MHLRLIASLIFILIVLPAAAANLSEGIIFRPGGAVLVAETACQGKTTWFCSWKTRDKDGTCPTTPPSSNNPRSYECMCGVHAGKKIGVTFGCQ
jgi:hypothetical protein